MMDENERNTNWNAQRAKQALDEDAAASSQAEVASDEPMPPINWTPTNEVSSAIQEASPEVAEPDSVSLEDVVGRIGQLIFVDPALCVPYPGSPRAGISYDEARDFELRQDILAHGVIEPITLLAGTAPAEVLSGNRRLAVVRQLVKEGFAITLPARVAHFDAVQAVTFAAAQNVGRLSPTPMQQARSIDWSLKNVEPHQAKLAEALGISEAKISRLALLAAMPNWVLEIVTDPESLSENFAGQLQRGLNSPATTKTMQKRANRLVEKQRTLPGPAAARYLVTGTLANESIDLIDRSGTRCASAKEDIKGGFTIRIPPAFRQPGADVEKMHTIIAAWLLALMTRATSGAI